MRRFLTYWTFTFLLFLPSWGLTALRGMASPVDLLWTAALAGSLAGLAAFGRPTEADGYVSRGTGGSTDSLTMSTASLDCDSLAP